MAGDELESCRVIQPGNIQYISNLVLFHSPQSGNPAALTA